MQPADSSSTPEVNDLSLDDVAYDLREFIASDGYRFGVHHWFAPKTVRRGCVIAIHGIQSHAGWYVHSSRRLAAAGFDLYFLDRRGSGVNQVLRGHSPHGDRLINDIAQVATSLRETAEFQQSPVPVTLTSVSWGGKLAAAFAIRRPDLIDALALLYPGIFTLVRPSLWQNLTLRAVRYLDIKWTQRPIPLDDPELFTRSPEWQEFIRNDPLALHQTTVGFQHSAQDLEAIVRKNPDTLRCPLLLMLAGQDRIADNRATRRYFERVKSTAKQLVEYPEAAHTLEFEPDRDRFVDDLIRWLCDVPRLRTAERRA
jgi:alpha-beta hydrolase superfamily lysophospholipase